MTTKAALMTGVGQAGIAQIEMVGEAYLDILGKVFYPVGSGGKSVSGNKGATHKTNEAYKSSRTKRTRGLGEIYQDGRLILGRIYQDGEVIDEVVVAVDEASQRVGINCHGSEHIAGRVLVLLERYGVQIVPRRELLNRDNIEQEVEYALSIANSPLGVKAVAAQYPGGLYGFLRQMICDLEEGVIQLDELKDEIQHLLDTYKQARWFFESAVVVVTGPVNSGKSTLVNALSGANLNIIADIEGTTRDWTQQSAMINGLQVELVDTAGWRDTSDPIEIQAVKTGQEQLERADVVLVVVEAGRKTGKQAELLIEKLDGWGKKNILIVANKADLLDENIITNAGLDIKAQAGSSINHIISFVNARDIVYISALQATGLEQLRGAITACLGMNDFDYRNALIFTERQQDLAKRLLQVETTEDAAGIIAIFLTGTPGI